MSQWQVSSGHVKHSKNDLKLIKSPENWWTNIFKKGNCLDTNTKEVTKYKNKAHENLTRLSKDVIGIENCFLLLILGWNAKLYS